MLLDEPFSGIDPLTVVDIQKIIADLSRLEIGILITDHNVPETLAVADRAYILHGGRISVFRHAGGVERHPGSAPRLSGRKFPLELTTMSWLQPRLQLKVSQKQILTPGLVQMVSVLALNRLELREMINQEMVANPMLEELKDESQVAEQDYTEEAFLKAETEKVPETEAANPFDEFDINSFFNQYLDSGSGNGSGEHEVIEKPSFEKFISSPQGLTEHGAVVTTSTPIKPIGT